MKPAASADPIYVMGHSAHERERLTQQAGLFGPFTERFLRTAGVAPEMRVLDAGCGVGDVSILCAALVGPNGAVIGSTAIPPLSAGRGNGSRRSGWGTSASSRRTTASWMRWSPSTPSLAAPS
jgi:hypothetical protein